MFKLLQQFLEKNRFTPTDRPEQERRRYRLLRIIMLFPLFVFSLLPGIYAVPETNAQEPSGDTGDYLTALDSPIVVDHNSVELFEQIPDTYIQAAANLDMLFIDRSVGANINDGLTCLGYPTDEDALNSCVRYEHPFDANFSVDPGELNWSRPGGYNRDNWDFLHWDNFPTGIRNANGNCSSWDQKANCFIELMTDPSSLLINQYDVASYQFSYLLVASGSTIDDQPGGYVWDNAGLSDIYDFSALETAYPNKTFIYWTTSLARNIGTPDATTFNNQMRQFAVSNDKILFDVADILSHDPDGNPCYDNRDGVPYRTENHPNDGVNTPALCQHYTTEVEGGHLGSVSVGKIRVARAFWVLMAQIAGWNPAGVPSVESVTPVDGEDNVPSGQALVIDFSQAMLPNTVTYSLIPDPGGISASWDGGNTQLTLSHNDFAPNTQYSATISTGTSVDGTELANAPFTWGFMSTGPRSDLNINKLAGTNQFATRCYTPDCSISYTLTIANAGSIFPATATVVNQWTPPEAVGSIRSMPAGCTGNLGNGTVTCNNITLADATPIELEVVVDTTEFTGSVQSTAVITLTGAAPEVFDPPADNSDTAYIFVNPTLTFLPILVKN